MDDSLRELYQELILEHGKRPRNLGRPLQCNRQALGQNPMCGDVVEVFLQVDAQGLVDGAWFEGKGCAISMASASMMTSMLKGRNIEEAEKLFHYLQYRCTHDGEGEHDCQLEEDDAQRIDALSGVRQFPMRVKCATLAWHAMAKALKDIAPQDE
ncbi:MAG: Fe-S cluster assembly sulfur transfer protein SufU [Alphaproteobacteria bacterium]